MNHYHELVKGHTVNLFDYLLSSDYSYSVDY